MANILIVGGGPAGLMLAIIMAELELPVEITVIDKKAWPINKICGQGIMPGGIKLLKKYGVLATLEQQSFSFKGICYINNDGTRASGEFSNNLYGVGIERVVLSEALLRRAKNFKQIRFESECKLIGLTESDNKFIPIVEHNGVKTALPEIDIIIGADGIHSQTRKLANLNLNPKTTLNRLGCRFHYDVKPWSNLVEVYWNNYIEVYVTPVSANRVELAFLWNRDQLKVDHHLALLPQFLNFFPELNKRLSNSVAIEKFQSIGPLYTKAEKFLNKNVILMGDAYYFYDAISAEGLSLAFKQAEFWANTFKEKNLELAKIHQDFVAIGEKINRDIIRPYNKITFMALLLNRFPLLRKIVIILFKQFPFLFKLLLNQKIIVE